MNDITVLLNGFKRKENIGLIYQSVLNQSVKPDEIMIWYNYPDDKQKINQDVVSRCASAISNRNWGVWARFAYALNARTKYICIFDDDTVPGERWLENCLNTIKIHRGLLGTVGLICDPNNYHHHVRFGWPNPNENVVEVDLVGHSWFFEREWLSAYWRDLPPIEFTRCGEDMHFSYAIQKYLNLKTYVPPHPINDKSLWGSTQGFQLGVDEVAISTQHNHGDYSFDLSVNKYFNLLKQKGWKLIKEKYDTFSTTF